MQSASQKAGGLEHRSPPGNLRHSRPQSWSSVLDAHQSNPSQKQHTVGWGAPGMRKGKRGHGTHVYIYEPKSGELD